MRSWNHEMQQYPEELYWFADQLLRNRVNSLLTIGVFHGGVEWHLAREYQFAGQRLVIHAVDPYKSPAHPDVLGMIAEECPLVKVEFVYCGIEDFGHELYVYDGVFIDGDHSEESVRRDLKIARGTTARLIAMHDIVTSEASPHTAGSARVWEELRANWKGGRMEYAAHPGVDKGIGILLRPTLAWGQHYGEQDAGTAGGD